MKIEKIKVLIAPEESEAMENLNLDNAKGYECVIITPRGEAIIFKDEHEINQINQLAYELLQRRVYNI